jgi:4-amino-4-deoxy-L-arabinose transferase-like glycosyltransferase
MVTVPLADTSEPRYAETARIMATSGDWITLWFEPGVPFWGKPPLSFWAEALSFRLFGVTEFAARFPSWLATAATLALIYKFGTSVYNERAARWAVLVYASCLLSYLAAGAVLTDPFLALGVTLSMVSFVLARTQASRRWGYGFFVGLAIGLLAKGPLAVVLVGGALVPWMLWQSNAKASLRALPWVSGCLLMAALVLPWYIAAEIKTPGFLHYFIVGEHILRFIDPGWTGDRYGTAHHRAHGSIWLDGLLATFPWGLAAVGVLLARLGRGAAQRSRLWSTVKRPHVAYLVCWLVCTPLFFTFSGNILWTYVLPAMPAFALLMGAWLDGLSSQGKGAMAAVGATALVPLLGVGLAVAIALYPDALKTEKGLVETAYGTAAPPAAEPPLIYMDDSSFSARFYSGGQAQMAPMAQLDSVVGGAPPGAQIAIPLNKVDEIPGTLRSRLAQHYENRRFALFTVLDPRPN